MTNYNPSKGATGSMAFATGFLTGLALTVLLTPKKGQEVRDHIKRKVTDTKNHISDKANDAKNEAKSKLDDVKDNMTEKKQEERDESSLPPMP